ncbi:MAG: 4'-phosphopantetheinyl transferase family protein [Cyclobacteriaceae bacterium]|jgi:4'-phosphopantetheinyl transferase
MPVFDYSRQNQDQAWALWSVTETEEELAYGAMETAPDELIAVEKRLEWLAGRALLRELTGRLGIEYTGLRKDEFGKPFLKGSDRWISLSHSFPYVAAQVAPFPVGVDVEQAKPKVIRIAPRILSPSELADAGQDVLKHTVYWCAKEALFKIHGRKGMFFAQNLHVAPFTLNDKGVLHGEIRLAQSPQSVTLAYRIHPEFVFVFTETI